MVDKHIADLTEDTTPVETSDLVIQQPSGGSTRKAKLINLLKNVFSHKTVWKDLLVSGFEVESAAGGNNPIWTSFRDGLYAWGFRGTSGVDQVFFAMHLGHDFKAGQSPTLHVHWTHKNATPTGNVKWNIEYNIAQGYGGIYGASSTLSVVQAAGPQYSHHITNDDSMPVPSSANLEPDAILIGRLYRDASDVADTFADDALLLFVDLHYQADKVGTTERNRPFPSGGFA